VDLRHTVPRVGCGSKFPRYGREGMAQESEREVEKHMERDGDCGPYRYIIIYYILYIYYASGSSSKMPK